MSVPHQEDSRAVADSIAESARMYPLREFPGERRFPNTAWMIIDLIAITPSSPHHLIKRTFQARELINDNVSVHLPELRTHSFFTEVRKLLVLCGRLGDSTMRVWDDEALNKLVCGLAEEDAGILAMAEDRSLLNGKNILECKKVVELFERATKRGLEKLEIYISWYDSSLSQELSLVRHYFRHETHHGTRHENRHETRLESLLEPRQESQQEESQQEPRQEPHQVSGRTRASKVLKEKMEIH